MLDSGAFSAAQLGRVIDRVRYCDFALEARDWPDVEVTIVNLDEIDRNDPEEAARIGYDNFLYMRSRGLNPMPVLHEGESPNWLDRYLDAGCDYVGLGSAQGNAKANFYDAAWDRLRDSAGNPRVKVHCFGGSIAADLQAYPWASADSLSWLSEHRFTHLETPEQYAESAYTPARRYARLQREIQDARPSVPFRFYMVIGPSSWCFPTLFAVHHRSALVSFAYAQPGFIERLKTFIRNPHALLAREPYKSHLDLLFEVAERYAA